MEADLIVRVFQWFEDKYIVGVDPGESTGYVEVESGIVITKKTLEIQQVWKLLNGGTWYKGSIVVIEDYLEYHSSRGGNIFKKAIPARIIGAFQCHQFGEEYEVVLRHANAGKQACPDDLLKLFFDTKGFTKHEKDALRHVVAYALSQIGGKITKGVQ